jgi:hypothetical protein
MRWQILAILTAVMLLAIHVSPAVACINDRESLQSEKEFKSSYIEKEILPLPKEQYEPAPSSSDQLITYGSSGIGLALLAGACVLGMVRTRRVS